MKEGMVLYNRFCNGFAWRLRVQQTSLAINGGGKYNTNCG